MEAPDSMIARRLKPNVRNMQRAVFVGNARSSRSSSFMQAYSKLLAAGIAIDEAYIAAGSREVRRYVRGAIRAGRKLVIVGGGDGTLSGVAGAFAYADVTLGVLPLGTGNSFARSLGIRADLDAAVAVIAGGHLEYVDLGRVNKRYFANVATIGLPADISAATPAALKETIGDAAYAVAGFMPLLAHRAFTCSVRWKSQRLKLRTHHLIVANGRFFGDTPIAPDATLTDARLALYTTTAAGKWALGATYVALAAGKQTDLGNARYFSARKIRITTSPRVAIAVDGDVIGRTPACFRVAPRALRVIVPLHHDV